MLPSSVQRDRVLSSGPNSPLCDLRDLLASQKAPFVFLDSAQKAPGSFSYLFSECEEALTHCAGESLEHFYAKAEGELAQGRWLAGCLNFEFGYLSEPRLKLLVRDVTPVAWLGAWKPPRIFSQPFDLCPSPRRISLTADTDWNQYRELVRQVQDQIRAGNTYELNLTFSLTGPVDNPLELYLALRAAQPTQYCAYLNLGDRQLLSFSPELFFRRDGALLTTQPMKGTSPRVSLPPEDQHMREALVTDAKTRAENLIVVDLVRNDLGRIASDVRVDQLFRTESHPTVHQMTSSISATLKPETRFGQLWPALFPSGSVSGAPKVETLRLIHQLEGRPRGAYTGAIGFYAPGDRACFNVAIRTLEIQGAQATLSVGGGIVADSKPAREFREALLKSRFATAEPGPPALLETLRWDRDGEFFLLDLHLDRLERSADRLGYVFDRAETLTALKKSTANAHEPAMIRLTLSADGTLETTLRSLPSWKPPVKLSFALDPLEQSIERSFHKTVNRNHYDRAREAAQRNGADEVIFVNARGEITEGSISNIFVERDGKLWTPAIHCGLIAGVYRESLLRQGRAQELVLTKTDLLGAALCVGNSVRGLAVAELVGKACKKSDPRVE